MVKNKVATIKLRYCENCDLIIAYYILKLLKQKGTLTDYEIITEETEA